MVYHFKDFLRRAAGDKVLHDKAFHVAKNQNGCQRELGSLVYRFFDKKSDSLADKSAFSSGVKSEIISNQN